MTTAKTSDYWFSPSALFIQLNAVGDRNYIHANTSFGTMVMCYMRDIEGLGYDNGHNYRRWPLIASPTVFHDNEKRYVYIAIPKSTDANAVAQVVYPSVEIDIYGCDAEENQIGPTDYYYIFTQGIISASVVDGVTQDRVWEQEINAGRLATDEAVQGITADFWTYDETTDRITFIKDIEKFNAIYAAITHFELNGKILNGVAGDDTPENSKDTVVTPSWASSHYISKISPDIANGKITFKDGLDLGNFVTGLVGGQGGRFDKYGNGELESLIIRQFLEVPELRFNRIDVVSGELWNSICFGTIESVDTKRRIAVLKLQDGELSGIKVGDICRGIFHCLEGSNPTESKEDECGFLQLAGFSTSYFTPTEVYDNGASFKYTLRQGTSVHPQVGMKFAVYGSFTDKTRRASAYMTRTYTRYLNNVDTWQIRPDVHVYGQQGDLEGLTINGMDMHGYGAYLHNLYLSGVHIEFDRDWIDHNIPKTYNVVLTTYERTVVTDIEGNPLTGLEEIRNIISEDGNVVSGESNVIANRLALTTTVQASKGSTPLLYSEIMDEGRFVVSLQCIGCTAKCENGVVMVTSLDMESMEHQVMIEVNCEGEAVYQQIFNVPVVKQGENGVTADLDNEMATIAANDKGKPIVEPFEEIISHGRLWYGNEEMYLVKAEVAVPGGITVADVTRVTDEEGQHNYLPIVDNKYCTLRITDVGEDAADISQIRIELFGRIKEQMNTEYSKVVVFTLNKVRMGENAQNYSLLSTSPIMQADGKGNVTTTQVACSVLASDGKTMTELTTADELTEHTLTMKVQLYNANDAVSEEVAYTIGTNLVVGTSTIGGLKLTKDSVRLVFSLYWQDLLIDKEGIPMIKDGSSTVRIDLDNENDSILYNDAGEKMSSDCYTNIKVYDGSKNVTSSCTLSIDYRSYVSAYISGTQCFVTSVSSTTGYARIAAYYPADGNTYYAIFSIKRLVGEDKYEIVTSPTTVSYDPNKKEYSAASVKVDVYHTGQNGVRSIISSSNTLPSGYALQKSTDGSSWATMSAGSSITPDYTLPNIYLRIVDNNDKVRDSETVPVVIGGSDSTSYWLISPVSAFSLSPSGSYTPSSFSVTMKKKTGEGEVDNCSDFYLSVWGVGSNGGIEYVTSKSEKSYQINVSQPSSNKSYTSLLVVASSDVPSSNNYPSKIVAELGIGIVTDGKAGEAGNSIFLIDKGIFKPNQSYKFAKMEGVANAYERDWVLYNPGGGSYYAYAVKTMGTTDLQTAPSVAGASDSNWEFLNKHESVLADTLIGVNCNIGGFAVTNEQFASQNYLTNDAGICINGKNGEIIAKQSSTSEWKVDTSGNMSIGNPSGQRIVVNPETRDIKVFDSSNNLVTTISGETVSSISNLFGSAGSISAVSSAVGFTIRGTGTIQTKKEYITISNYFSAEAGAKLSASCSLYLSATPYTDTGDATKPQIMGNSISARIVYTDSYGNIYGALTGNFSVVGDIMSGGAGSNTLRGSAIVKSSGYYYVKLEVKYAVGAASLNLVAISNIENIGLSLVADNYLSRLLANGFCFGSTNANYIAALNESNGNMHFDFKSGSTQLELTNSNFVLKSQYGKVFPTILWVYCSYSAISSYFTATGIKPTFTKSSTGSYVIDYSACNLGTLSASNTILSVTSVYGEYRTIQIGNLSTGKFPILSFDKSGNAADTYFILQVQRII